MNCELRIGNGYDVHRLAPGLKLTLGGLEIAHSKGCVAHSDGDVLIHALCDALLGALAMGDIGHHFPDTSSEFKGIDSKILLKRTYDMILDRGYSLVNADLTLLLQAPKVEPYIEQMRSTLASVMGVGVDAVSVKATTEERFTGREEGVAAYAVVLLAKN